jgi:hypothetical protein
VGVIQLNNNFGRELTPFSSSSFSFPSIILILAIFLWNGSSQISNIISVQYLNILSSLAVYGAVAAEACIVNLRQ